MGITQQIGASSLIKAGVVDNTANRPASPYEGQVIFQKDTDQLLVWNGTAWVIPNSPAQNPQGLEFITSQTLSGTSTNIVGCFSATYDSYLVLGQSIGASSSPDLMAYRMLVGTTPLTGGNYYTCLNGYSHTGTQNLITYQSNAGFTNRIMGTGTDQSSFSFTFDNPFKTKKTFTYGTSTSNGAAYYGWAGSANVDTSTSYDGLQLLSNSGFTISGTVTIYGYRK